MTLKKKLICSAIASNLMLLLIFLLVGFLSRDPSPVRTSIETVNPGPTITPELPPAPTKPAEAPKETPELPIRTVEVVLEQPFPSPEIVVEAVDPDGIPLEGVSVGWKWPFVSSTDTLVTDEQGRVRLRVSKSGYQRGGNRLFVNLQGRAPACVWVHPDEDFRRVVLEPGIDFSGRVVDQLGYPIANAPIRILHGEGIRHGKGLQERQQADSDGFFFFSGLSPDGFVINIDVPGFLQVEHEIFAEQTTSGMVEFGLVAEREISVVVLDREGLPINGAIVRVATWSSEGRHIEKLGFSRQDGRARIRGIPSDMHEVFLVVDANGYDDVHRRVLVQESQPVDLTVQFTESYDESKISPRFMCSFMGNNPFLTGQPTDLPNIYKGLPEEFDAQEEKRPVPDPPQYATVVGQLVDADGRPLEVSARGPGWYDRHADGYFEIRVRANEPTKIVAVWDWPPGHDGDQPVEPFELTSEPLVLAPGERRELVLRIPELVPVTVTVSDLHGEPVSAAFVTIVRDSHVVWSDVPTSGHGTVEALLPSGEYTFKASMIDRFEASGIKDNPEGLTVASHVAQVGSEARGVDLVVDRGGCIFGRLVDSSGQSVPERWISVRTPGTDTRKVRSDATGAFELDGLIRGSYTILVEGPRGLKDCLEVKGVRLDDSPLELVLPRSTLSVLVVDENTGESLSAKLRLSHDYGAGITAKTDARGRCIFRDISPGAWTLEVVLEDSLEYTFAVTVKGNSEIRLPVARGAFFRFESLPVELLSDKVLGLSFLEDYTFRKDHKSRREGALWKRTSPYLYFNWKAWESQSPVFGPFPVSETIVSVRVKPDHGHFRPDPDSQSYTDPVETSLSRKIKLRLDAGPVTTVDWNDSGWTQLWTEGTIFPLGR